MKLSPLLVSVTGLGFFIFIWQLVSGGATDVIEPEAEVLEMPQDVASIEAHDKPSLQVTDSDVLYSPYVMDNYPNQVFFGDTHTHTAYSTDAGLFGATLTPDDAYRFAKGHLVRSSTGVLARLERPLDFLVVADHAENLGLSELIRESNEGLLKNEWGQKIYDLVQAKKINEAYALWGAQIMTREDPLKKDNNLAQSMWHRMTASAEKHNEPGKFSAIIGFEWTASPGGRNLHRNILFRNNKTVADQIIPYSVYDSENPEDLWKWMQSVVDKTGAQILAIPHNGNVSNGLMFDDVRFPNQEPIDADYAKLRRQWEPIYEITQIKGDGETHPKLSPNDPFADFETWDRGSFGGAKEPGQIEKEYARQALMRGLSYEAKLGINPFKFGVIGSTDAHTGLSSTQENNFFGKISAVEPTKHPGRFDDKILGLMPDPQGRNFDTFHYEASASGLAAVWARENTREALWDALARREVYATTGTRIRVRFFCGKSYSPDDLYKPDFAKIAYSKGAPMGGDLSLFEATDSMGCVMRALKDPDGANLDRVQVIKGWIDKQGKAREKVYDVAWSGDRKKNAKGQLPAVGNTVDEVSATYSNTIGTPVLQGYWQDPDFDREERAFYYVRVLEIPTPRWTTVDAAFFKVERPKGVPVSIQERAYTSAIWYTPAQPQPQPQP